MQRLQNGKQCARRLRQTVFDALRHFVLQRPAVDEAVRLQFAQLRNEYLARCPRNHAQQLGETQRAAFEVIHDGRLPLSADAVHRNFDAAEIVFAGPARAHRFCKGNRVNMAVQ